VDKARSREAGGAGLGLAIVAATAERMGGSIAAESEVGKGSRFTVKFPLVPEGGLSNGSSA
jgi:two-component system phosphate regulon sensor histidine kinase PhoR